MQVVKLHEDEVDVDEGLVRRLLAAQAPAWADLPLRLAEPAGTDNVMIRLGEDLVVRLPRTQSAAEGLDKEQQVVPRLAAHLPAPVPVPVVQGALQGDYPWAWSISHWLPGRPARPGVGDVGLARQFAEFVVTLRALDTFGLAAEGALHSYRGDPLADRDDDTRECIAQCHDLLDTSRVTVAWDRAVDVEEYAGPPVWMHADLQPGNLLVGAGFTEFTARKAWRETEHTVDHVTFRSYSAYNAGVLGCTSYSFTVEVGVFYKCIKPDLDRRVEDYDCEFRAFIGKNIVQDFFRTEWGPARDAPEVWYLLPDGSNLSSVVEGACALLVRDGLPFLDRYHDPALASKGLMTERWTDVAFDRLGVMMPGNPDSPHWRKTSLAIGQLIMDNPREAMRNAPVLKTK